MIITAVFAVTNNCRTIDEHVLTANEITTINDRIAAFNTTIKNVADANSRLAHVDINSQFAAFIPGFIRHSRGGGNLLLASE